MSIRENSAQNSLINVHYTEFTHFINVGKSYEDKYLIAFVEFHNPTDQDGLFDERPANGKSMLYFAKQQGFKNKDQLYKIRDLLVLFLQVLKMKNIINY
jgi:hypothetical protein